MKEIMNSILKEEE